jgi:hypothetical protein
MISNFFPDLANSRSTNVTPVSDTTSGNGATGHVRLPQDSARISIEDDSEEEINIDYDAFLNRNPLSQMFEGFYTEADVNVEEAANVVFETVFRRSDDFYPFKSAEEAVMRALVNGDNEIISRKQLAKLLFTISLLIRLAKGDYYSIDFIINHKICLTYIILHFNRQF